MPSLFGPGCTRPALFSRLLSALIPLATSALVVPSVATAQWGGGNYGGGGSGPGTTVTPFTLPLRIPAVMTPVASDATTDYYVVTQKQAQQEIIPGKLTTIWGYEGTYPGPTFRVRSGRRVAVHQVNLLPESVSVHLHGGHTPASSDGHPNDLIVPGAARDYIYPNGQLPATLWYHDHAVDATGFHVNMGLAGFYIIGDAFEDALNLPSGSNDIPLVLQDRMFNSDGSFYYPLNDSTIDSGVLGDRFLVNGVVQPYLNVGSRKVRFRILNGSNARVYTLSLSTGQPLIQIGTDGGLLSAPVSRSSITLAPAERADVVIDFSGRALGTTVTLRNGSNPDLMRFNVARNETDTSVIPATLRPMTHISESQAVVTRRFSLQKGYNNGRSLWTINNRLYDPARTDATVQHGQYEIWEFDNNSGESHPMHIHLSEFQVLSGGGSSWNGSNWTGGTSKATGADGWKDTFLVPAWGSIRVIGKFDDYTGNFVFHCHKLEHEDHAMMGQFLVQ